MAAVICVAIAAVPLAGALHRPAEFHRIQPLLLLPTLAASFAFGSAGALFLAGVSLVSGIAVAIVSDGPWPLLIGNALILSLAAWGGWRFDAAARDRQIQNYHLLNQRMSEVEFLRAQVEEEKKWARALQDKADQWGRLSGSVHAVTASLFPDKVRQILLGELQAFFPGRQVVLALKSDETDPLAQIILNRNENLLILDLENDFRFRHLADQLPFRSCIAVPIQENAAPVGMLLVTDRSPGAFDMDHLRLLYKFSEIAAVILRNADIYEKTDRLGRIDGLTGLYKRWYFQNRFDELGLRATRGAGRLAIVMCDIDFFKKVNDRFGHLEGDRVLRGVGEMFKTWFERHGIAARYGGEEFIAVIPDLPEPDAFDLVERFRAGVEARTDLSVTVSCGLAIFPTDCEEIGRLIDTADHALYQAKESGRNRVARAARTPAS